MATLEKGWLAYNGVELFNNDRVLSYAQHGVGGVTWDPLMDAPGCSCWANRVYTCDVDGHSAGDPLVYTTPNGGDIPNRTPQLIGGDVAPWYDAAVPASNDFYGIFVRNITGLDSMPYSRTVAQSASLCGGIMKSPNLTGREMVVTGTLMAGTCAGMEYGRRWLNDMLFPGCGASEPTMEVQIYCPDADADVNDGIRRLYGVGVLQMPQYNPAPGSLCCNFCDFTMIFYAENPYLHRLNESVVIEPSPPTFVFPGTAGEYVSSTYDNVDTSVTGDFVMLASFRYTGPPGYVQQLISKDYNEPGRRGYYLALLSDGRLEARHSEDGVSLSGGAYYTSLTMNAVVGTTRDVVIAAAVDVDNGFGASTTDFYYSVDDGFTWNVFQLGRESTGAAGGVFDNGEPLVLGAGNNGETANFKGIMYWGEVRSGTWGNSTVVERIDAKDTSYGKNYWISHASGHTITMYSAGETGGIYIGNQTQFDFEHDNFSEACCEIETSCLGKSYAVAEIMATPTFVVSSTLRIEIEPGCNFCICPELDDNGNPIPGSDNLSMEDYLSLPCEPYSSDEPQDACMTRITVMPSRHEEYPMCPNKDAIIDFFVKTIPAGTKFVLDGASGEAYFADSRGNYLRSAMSEIKPKESYSIFPTLAPCAKVCVQVVGTQCGTPSDTKVHVYRIDKEI